MFDQDKRSFFKKGYSKEQINLFCDIAFRESNTIRKWNSDINIEIKDIDNLDLSYISDVDSCFAILSPLVKPLKIKRVVSGGNLSIIFMNRMPLQMGMATGYCRLNNLWLTSNINNVERDILKIPSDGNTLLHEMKHALGLAHPKRK